MTIIIGSALPRPVPRPIGKLHRETRGEHDERATTTPDEPRMAEGPRKILVCSCEDTMPLDGDALRRCLRGAEVIAGRQLCRAELSRAHEALTGEDAVVIACTQEAPVFNEVAAEIERKRAVTFVNIRETAGWSKDAKAAGAKIAALIAAAAEPTPEMGTVSFNSEGAVLIYGS